MGGFETTGAGADLHHIRPSESKTNSDRSNLKYGNVTSIVRESIGNLSGLKGGDKGDYYEPVDNAKGDVARICLYVYARYGTELSKCSDITNVFQSVEVLLEWCELDPVDEWEMGRNDVIEEIQGNRNVFIDYPEYAWLIFDKEVPSDMVTPSGEAKKVTHPTTEDTDKTTEGNDTEVIPEQSSSNITPPSSDEPVTGTEVVTPDQGTTGKEPEAGTEGNDSPETQAPSNTDEPQSDVCAHTFSEWQEMDNGGKLRSCTQCGAFEFASQNNESDGKDGKGCAGSAGDAGAASMLVAILGFAFVIGKKSFM